jgi:hypothetical protein
MDFEGKPFKLKLYPPLRNIAKGVHIAKGKNILEYRAKVNALSKPRINHPSFTLALKGVQTSKHKRNKDKTLPLEIRNEGFKELLVFHKKQFMRHGSQLVKQILKTDMILEHFVLL